MRAGRFREDLFHRLNVVTLTLLPLRERREDVLPLAYAELRRLASAKGERPPKLGDAVSLAEIEREHIACVIGATKSLGEAASVLAIDPRTLERERRLYGLK